jgi:TonB family protein
MSLTRPLPLLFSALTALSVGCASSAPDPTSGRMAEWQKTPSQLTSPSVVCRRLFEPKPHAGRPPDYPPELRKQRVQGRVLLTATIGADGVPREPKVASSPHPGLTESCVDSILRMRFDPAMCDGTPVEVLNHYSCNYTLR